MSGGQSFDDTASRRLEAVYQTPDVIAQRHRTLTALEPREGEHILDIGAGPGLLIADMAAVVGPSGHVTGVEISDSVLAVARRRLASSAIGDRVTLVKATPQPCRSLMRRSTPRPPPRSTSTSPTSTRPSPSCIACSAPAAAR